MTAPDSNPKTAAGRLKPSLHAIPPSALIALGLAMENGENKYGLMNWRGNPVSSSVYYDAALRHFLSWWDGENQAADSGVHHLAHVMACCAILIDAEITATLIDDRPQGGPAASLIAHLHDQRVAAAQAGHKELAEAVDQVNSANPPGPVTAEQEKALRFILNSRPPEIDTVYAAKKKAELEAEMAPFIERWAMPSGDVDAPDAQYWPNVPDGKPHDYYDEVPSAAPRFFWSKLFGNKPKEPQMATVLQTMIDAVHRSEASSEATRQLVLKLGGAIDTLRTSTTDPATAAALLSLSVELNAETDKVDQTEKDGEGKLVEPPVPPVADSTPIPSPVAGEDPGSPGTQVVDPVPPAAA